MARRTTTLIMALVITLAPVSGCARGSTSVDDRGIQAPPLGAGGESSGQQETHPPSSNSRSASATASRSSSPPADQTASETGSAVECLINPSPANGPKLTGGNVHGGLQVVCPDRSQTLHVVFHLEYSSTGADWRHDPGWGTPTRWTTLREISSCTRAVAWEAGGSCGCSRARTHTGSPSTSANRAQKPT